MQMKVLPGWLLKLLAVFMPMLSELNEMSYQWEQPFIVDDSRFRAEFAVNLVGIEDAAKATVAWAKDTYRS
jgi:hypothetical protein